MKKLILKKNKINYIDQIYQLIHILSKETKIKLAGLCILMLITAVMELISLGAIYPFLSVITNPQSLDKYIYLSYLVKALDIRTNVGIAILLATIFSVLALVSGYIRVLSIRYQIKTSHNIGVNLSVDIYNNMLSRPYLIQINNNSSKAIAGITSKCDHLIMSGIYPALIIINSIIILIVILAALIIIDPLISTISMFSFGAAYFFIMTLFKKGLSRDSNIVSIENDRIIKILQESFGGIRDIIIGGVERVYINTYRKAYTSLKMSVANIQITSVTPRYIIEPIGMTLIAILACLLIAKSTDDGDVIPLLGIFAIAAQRIIPLLQQAYSAWSAIVGGGSSFKDALDMLSQHTLVEGSDNEKPLKFEKEIKLKDVSLSYRENEKKELNNINLHLKKGSRIGIIGQTGSGKSTLVDCIMGLLITKIGHLEIDGVIVNEYNKSKWQKNITHVPQSIFIIDASVAENIAFGVPLDMIDYERINKSAECAQILSDIQSWKNGFNEVIGERGVKISGGQRQRIGIARALYKKAELIILDEATSALDSEIEKKVMNSIMDLAGNLTLIIIAHRLESLKNCTEIIEMHHGKILKIGSYEEIISSRIENNEIR